jgi:Na+-driven multidrug efflux pump
VCKKDTIDSVFITLGYLDFYFFQIAQISILASLGNLGLSSTASYSIIFFSTFYVPLEMGFGDAITAKISAPFARGDGKKLQELLWQSFKTFLILFTCIVAIPALFSHYIFGLMKVHADIQKDVYRLILWSLPSVFVAGVGEILKAFLVNFGKTNIVGVFSIIGGVFGAIGCYFFIIVLQMGFTGLVLSMYTFTLGTLLLGIYNYNRYTMPIMKKLEVEYQQQQNQI